MKFKESVINRSEYRKYIFKRYSGMIPESPLTSEEHSLNGVFEFILEAPYHFGVEDDMMEYVKTHPDATVFDVFDYFKEIVPPQNIKIKL